MKLEEEAKKSKIQANYIIPNGDCATVSGSKSSLVINDVRKSTVKTKKRTATSHRTHVFISLADSLIQKEIHLHLSQYLSDTAVFAHAHISKMCWPDWTASPFTIPWQPKSVPNNNVILSLIEEKMIRDWRGK